MNKILLIIKKYWHILFMLAMIPIIVWTSVFHLYYRNKPIEELTIIFLGDDLKETELEDDLVNELQDCGLKSINIDMVDSKDKQTVLLLMATRLKETDVVILTDNYYDSNFITTLFKPLDEEYLDSKLEDLNYYQIDNQSYGIVINSKENKTSFSKYLESDKSCSLFINNQSENFSSLNTVKGNDVGIDFIQYLTEAAYV